MKYTLPEIEELRDAVEELSKWEDSKGWNPGSVRIDPLLLERRLITYMSNETTVEEILDRIKDLEDRYNKRIKKEQEARVNTELGSMYLQKFTDYNEKCLLINELESKRHQVVLNAPKDHREKMQSISNQILDLNKEIATRFGPNRMLHMGRTYF